MSKKEEFSSRWGIILAALGMAIGAGNLWRFPRLAGQYGGTFILLWVLFLFIWSIPLLLAEFSIGKRFKKGVIGSYAKLAGKPYTWAGFFITLCTLGIAFYYSVVTAWGLRYLGFSVENLYHEVSGGAGLASKLNDEPELLNHYWQEISNANGTTMVLYVVAVLTGTWLLMKGIQKGLENANKILIPGLFLMLLLIAFVALSMEGGAQGLEYMFHIDFALFLNPKIWLEALSQSAWSTGAGWGLMMTISSYSRSDEDVTLNTFIGAFGNNSASILAGMAILPAVFALSDSAEEATHFLQSGNYALTFTIIPQLFGHIPGGSYLTVLFFLAFSIAAFSSFLPMIELFISNLIDLGLQRKKAAILAAGFCILLGFPSAYSLDFFSNQDWVWGLGLIVNGLLIIIAVLRYGSTSFKQELIDSDADFRIPTLYFRLCMAFNVPFGLFLLYWWMSQGYSEYPWFDNEGNWNVIDTYSNATILSQWLLVVGIGVLFNNYLYRYFVLKKNKTYTELSR